MKRITALLTAAVLLCGCTESGGDNGLSSFYKPIEGEYPAFFEYTYGAEVSERIAVSDDGRMIITISSFSAVSGFKCDYMEYSMDGSVKKLFTKSGYPDAIAFMGDGLYIAETILNDDGTESTEVYRLDTATGEKEPYASVPMKYCFTMRGGADELYLLGDDPSKRGLVCDYWGYSGDTNSNRSVYRVHNGEAEKIDVDFPTAVCAKYPDGAVIAACDGKGFHFVEYSGGVLGENIYIENQNNVTYGVYDLGYIDGGYVVYSVPVSAGEYRLCASSLKNMDTAELIPNENASEIYTAGGYCFYTRPIYYIPGGQDQEKNERVIERIRFSDYFKGNDPISFICSQQPNYTPFSCGYLMKMSGPSNDEAALKILSNDKDYDMCCISTRDEISYAIKSKGSFYPLNGVPGISDYLDKCFPAIKEAFTNENGEIWALPVRANSFCFAKNYGDTDLSKMGINEFIDFIDGLSGEDAGRVTVFPRGYICEVLKEYVMTHESFDTAGFREAAERFKGSKSFNTAHPDFKPLFAGGYEWLLYMYYTDTVLGMESTYSFSQANGQSFTASGIPCISASDVLIPNVIFLCVNPNSSHLQDALDYIARLAEYQLTNPDQLVLTPEYGAYSDNEVVRRLAELSADAPIYFTYPEELYIDDFYKYLSGDISLDDFIKEADRKLNTYLKE